LERIDEDVTEYRASTADEFWEALSPQRYLFGPSSRPIFRGQKNSTFKLEPSILRKDNDHIYSSPTFGSRSNISENRIFVEIHILNRFARYCDSAGLRIPGDSQEFRRQYLHPPTMMDSFILHRKLWPSDEYFEIMALAQHYGLPTRLLDWSHSSYVAAYFAASGALRNDDEGRFAVWALNTEDVELKLKNMRTIRVPGSNNANVAAQRGLFTLLLQEYARGQPFKEPHCLEDYAVSCESHNLAKITLPILEAPKVIDLCERYGVTAAALYPDFYGAAKATLDSLACWERSEWTDGRDIRAQTLPMCIKPPTE
jgi:hypothetical protein